MARKFNMVLRPAAALVLLVRLADASATPWPSGLGPRLRRELQSERARLHDELSLYQRCVVWMERRRLAQIDRARRPDATGAVWGASIQIRADLDALAEKASREENAEGRARVSLHALRRVLKFISQRGLIDVASLRVGKSRASVTDALSALDGACAEQGVALGRALPGVLDAEVARVAATPVAPVKPAPTTTRAAERPTRPAPASTSNEPSPKVESPRRPPTAPPSPKASCAGFGDLPDDAEPEDRAAKESLSARGLSADAEFFLQETGVADWPCDPLVLARARKNAVSRLHPDRAGDASAMAFHRVLKGHAELLRKLPPRQSAQATAPPVVPPAVPASVAPPVAVASPASVVARPRRRPTEAHTPMAVPPTPKSSVCEWPPPSPPVQPLPTTATPAAAPRRAPHTRREARAR